MPVHQLFALSTGMHRGQRGCTEGIIVLEKLLAHDTLHAVVEIIPGQILPPTMQHNSNVVESSHLQALKPANQ